MANVLGSALRNIVAFLNHLCDGEPVLKNYNVFVDFLNHLCDGELFNTDVAQAYDFLNHLCDGEPDKPSSVSSP